MIDLFIFDVDKIMIEIDLITNKKWKDILEPLLLDVKTIYGMVISMIQQGYEYKSLFLKTKPYFLGFSIISLITIILKTYLDVSSFK